MDRLDNPYRPGAGTAPPALIGRDELIDAFGVTIRRALTGRPGKSYMPIGLRGVGKTVLLNRFSEIAEHEGMLVAFVEAPETGDVRTLLSLRLRKALLQLQRAGSHRVPSPVRSGPCGRSRSSSPMGRRSRSVSTQNRAWRTPEFCPKI